MLRIAAASRVVRILTSALLLPFVGCTLPNKPTISIVPTAAENVQVNANDHNSGDFGNYTIQSETSHAVFEEKIVVGWNDNNEGVTVVQDFWNPQEALVNLTGYGVSTNGGSSFSDKGSLPTVPGYVTQGDPAVAVDGEGNFYFASLAARIDRGRFPLVVARSKLDTSGHTTFDALVNAPVLIRGLLTENSATGEIPFQDKPLIAVDTGRDSPYYGTVYVAWSEFSDRHDDTSPRIRFTRSICQSEGQRFCPEEQLAFADRPNYPNHPIDLSDTDEDAGDQGAMPAVGPDGEVYVAWGRFTGEVSTLTGQRDIQGQEIWIRKSEDGGNSFGTARRIPVPKPAPANLDAGGLDIRTRGFPYIAVDNTTAGPTRKNVYVVYQADPDGEGLDRSDIFFTRSTDEGENWSEPRSINRGSAVTSGGDTTTHDNWQPSIAVSPTTGKISVTFYDRRNDISSTDQVPPEQDPPNTRIMLYRAVSTDGGLTWFNEAVSNTTFKPATGGASQGANYLAADFAADYFGDYNFSFASDPYFHYTWGDSRRLCEPPAAADQPCGPRWRPDQNVFYAKVPVQAGVPLQEGPDLFITPWGNISGEGPRWRSPDVFVVDNAGAPINPKKGARNHLRVRVRNVGNQTAEQVQVRVRYAPLFTNLREEQLKEISPPAVVSIAPGAEEIVPIEWSLADLSDTNGGAWPKEVREFTHFCVNVTVHSSSEGSNKTHNNSANSNFLDVSTESSSFRFLIANPHNTPVHAELILSPLPKGFAVKLQDFAVPFGRKFKLAARETKVATLAYSWPADPTKNSPKRDVVADISLRIGREIVGGFSVRLFRATEKRQGPFTLTNPGRMLRSARLISATRLHPKPIAARYIATAAVAPAPALLQPQPRRRGYSQTYRADVNRVSDVISALLRDRRQPVTLVVRSRGVIKTGSVSISNTRLRQLVPANLVPKLGMASGRYLIGFRLQQVPDGTTVTIISLIIVKSMVEGPLGGRPIASNGVLENEYLRAIARAIQ